MSTGAIVAIVIAAVIIVIALAFVLPRLRERARVQRREEELEGRRRRVAAEHRETADVRARQAESAEQRARIAAQEARREHAEAELMRERAGAYERGIADDELIEEHERERFAGTSAQVGTAAGGDSVGSPRAAERVVASESRTAEDLGDGSGAQSADAASTGLFGRFRRRQAREPVRRA